MGDEESDEESVCGCEFVRERVRESRGYVGECGSDKMWRGRREWERLCGRDREKEGKRSLALYCVNVN